MSASHDTSASEEPEGSEAADASEAPEASDVPEASDAPEASEAPDTAEAANDAPSADEITRAVDKLSAAGITTTAAELQALAAKVGLGGAVRALAFAKASGQTPDQIVALFQGGQGWGQIKHQLNLSIGPGIGWIMGGHGVKAKKPH